METIKNNLQNIIIAGLLCIIFVQRSCNNNSTEVITKQLSTIKYDTLTVIKESPSQIKTKYKTIKGDIVYLPGKVDTVEVKVFEKANDTVKTKMFADVTKIRQYTTVFKDSLADVSIFTETKGELLKIVPTVNIKARLPEKKTVLALYTGGGLTLSIPNIKPEFFANLGFQNKRGDIIFGGIGTNKTIQATYVVRILNIKK